MLPLHKETNVAEPDETQHLQQYDKEGNWTAFTSACGERAVGWFQLWDHPAFVTCPRCKRTKQYQSLVAPTNKETA